MALLAGKLYDPAAAATPSVASLQAMTAIDTTNLRLTFTCPANGKVLVRIRCAFSGAATVQPMLLGVLDGATVRGRQVPIMGRTGGAAGQETAGEAQFLVTGLTPGNSYTWDAAVGVETAVAASVIRIGGPNNTTASDAGGGFAFEVWETTNLLAGMLYDPAVAVTKATSSLLALTALDTTNLRLTFTTAASGAGSTTVLVKVRACIHGASAHPVVHLGVLDGATVRCRAIGVGGFANPGSLAATDFMTQEALMLVTGLTASTSYTWDAAYGVDLVQASSGIKYGGPNNATAQDAFGGLAYEVWAA